MSKDPQYKATEVTNLDQVRDELYKMFNLEAKSVQKQQEYNQHAEHANAAASIANAISNIERLIGSKR